MDAKQLQEIEARWAKATPGPWCVEDGEIVKPINNGEKLMLIAGNEIDEDGFVGDFVLNPCNAAVIANAPTDIALLLAEVRKLQTEIKPLKGMDAL